MLTRIELTNFKNFQKATFQLGPLSIVVGTNASGKSNLRDAFRFIHGMARGYWLAEIVDQKYVEGGVLQWAGIRGGAREICFHNAKSFKIATQIDDLLTDHHGALFQWRHEIEVSVDPSALNIVPTVENEVVLIDGRRVMHSYFDSRIDSITESSIVIPPDVQGSVEYKPHRFANRKPAYVQALEASCFDKERSAKMWTAREIVKSMQFLDLSPAAMRMPSTPGNMELGDRGENLSAVLWAICEDSHDKAAVIVWVRQLTPLDVVDFDFPADQTGRVLLTLVEASGQRISAYSASDGTLRFLAIIAALMGPSRADVYFLEEIENGIHPTRLTLLLEFIEHQTRVSGVQVVATTHSPQLLALLSEESRQHASLVYRSTSSGVGRIRRIVDIPGAAEVLQTNNLARLFESGWLENAVSFAETDEVEANGASA